MPAMPRPEISIIVPLFNEEENLAEVYRRITATLARLGLTYELLLINDGSHDRTAERIDELQARDSQVVVIHLSRNFGHQAAISAGIDHARGQAVAILDGDLQDPPEVLDQFIEKWREGFDVVYAVRRQRKESWPMRAAYALFYRLLRGTSDLDMPLDSGDFCLMDRKVVKTLRRLPERMRFVRGLRSFAGFRQTGIVYQRAARQAGEPKYTLSALTRLAVDGLVSFSRWPLNLVTYLGLVSALLALGLMGYVLLDALHHQVTPRGWASTIVAVLLMSSVQLLSLGIIGEYVRRIFIECKGRPTYIVGRIGRAPRSRRNGPRPRNRSGRLVTP